MAGPPAGHTRHPVLRAFIRAPGGLIGGGLLLMLLVLAVAGPLIWGHQATVTDLNVPYQVHSPEHPLGTDSLGRDVLARLPDGQCTNCHANLTLKEQAKLKPQTAHVSSFGPDHPYGSTWGYGPDRKDPGNIRFNHASHLALTPIPAQPALFEWNSDVVRGLNSVVTRVDLVSYCSASDTGIRRRRSIHRRRSRLD